MNEYRITDIDYWELDALLRIDGKTIYFQFPRNHEPTLLHVLRYLEHEQRQKKE